MRRSIIALSMLAATGLAQAQQPVMPVNPYMMAGPGPAAPANPYLMAPSGWFPGAVPYPMPVPGYAPPAGVLPAPAPAPASPAPAAPATAAAPPGNPYLVQVPGVSLPNLPAYLGLLGYVSSFKPSTADKPYTMAQALPRQQKQAMMQAMMSLMPSMGIRDAMSFMATKYKAKPGLSFDDVVESMKLRANQLNFKLVGHSPMWKDIQAVLGDTEAPRMEVFHYCDIAAGRAVLKAAPESIAFLPCRIAIMEDADKAIWVVTLDWDMAWLDTVNGKMGIDPELAKYAMDIRDKMDNIMHAAAEGDL